MLGFGKGLAAYSREMAAFDYLSKLDTVEGWLNPTSAAAMIFVMRLQEERGLRGDAAEIGVYHGKSFLCLCAGLRRDETAIAIDIFEDQGHQS
jgi:hypothetical protein